MELLNGTENRIKELDKNVWGYCINMSKYVLVDFSKIIEDLEKIYPISFGYNFGPLINRLINDKDDGDEILIATKSLFGNTVLGKFVLIRKRNDYETKMIIDKIDNESGLKNFCDRILSKKEMKRGLIFHKNFFDLITDLKPSLVQITEYLIYVKQKKPAFLTERLDSFFTNKIKPHLLKYYKEEEKVKKMITSYVVKTIDYIEPSVKLVFPDVEVDKPFSEKTHEDISEIIQKDGYTEYKVGTLVYHKCLYDYLDENGQKLIDLNNNATPGATPDATVEIDADNEFLIKEPVKTEDITLKLEQKLGGNPKKTRRRKNKKRRSSKQQKSKK